MGLFGRRKVPAVVGDLGWDGVRSQVRPRLVGAQVESVRALALPAQVRASAQFVVEPVAGDVSVGVVVDSDDALAQVGPGLLASWGKSLGEVLEVAVASTFDRDVEMSRLAEGTYVVRDPCFAAALALRPAMASAFEVEGEVVAVFAAAGWALATGSQDVEGLRVLGDLLDDVVAQDDKPVSVTPLVVSGGVWRVFDVPEQVAESPGWRLAVRRWALLRASQQREPLAAHLAAQGQEVVVAPVELVKDRQGRVITYSPVTEGVLTAIVATDSVVHVGLDGSSQLRDFADVALGAGSVEDVDPSRWLVLLGAPSSPAAT